MLVKKTITKKSSYDQDRFLTIVEKTIKRLNRNGALVCLAYWGRIISKEPEMHNKLFVEIFFCLYDPDAKLENDEEQVSSVNSIILGKASTRIIVKSFVGTIRGQRVDPLQFPNHRSARNRFRLGV